MRSRDCGVRSGLWKASGKHGSPVGVSQSSREGTCYGWMWGIGGESLRVTASLWLDVGQSV